MSDNVSEKTYKERLEICKTCPNKTGRLMVTSRCKLCGCPIVTKALLKMSSCPDNKW